MVIDALSSGYPKFNEVKGKSFEHSLQQGQAFTAHHQRPQAPKVTMGAMADLFALSSASSLAAFPTGTPISRAPKFGALVHDGHSVTISRMVPETPQVIAKTLQALLQQQYQMGANDTIKFFMGGGLFPYYPLEDQSAMADMFRMVGRPVDVIVESAIFPDALKTLQSATGKRFITDSAEINLGPFPFYTPYDKTKDQKTRAQLHQSYMHDLYSLIGQKSGASYKQVEGLMATQSEMSPLQALGFGKLGLVDGILIGRDRVMTRANLDAYFEKHGAQYPKTKEGERAKAEFLKHLGSVHLVVQEGFTTPLAEYSPNSIPSDFNRHDEHNSLRSSFLKLLTKYSGTNGLAALLGSDGRLVLDKEKLKADWPTLFASNPTLAGVNLEDPNEFGAVTEILSNSPEYMSKLAKYYHYLPAVHMYTSNLLMDDRADLTELKPQRVISLRDYTDKVEMDNISEFNTGILDDDVVFFADGFDDGSAQQIKQSLIAIERKKRFETKAIRDDKTKGDPNFKPSNLKIYQNSPGGYIWSLLELKSLFSGLELPVDVIANGMSASCGALLLCCATGNRFATPSARVMLHSASTAFRGSVKGVYGLEQTEQDIAEIVSQRTGRNLQDVRIDFQTDTWLNPFESLVYGPNGMLDAVLVGPNQVVTQGNLKAFLQKNFFEGSPEKLENYLSHMMDKHRDPRLEPDKFNADIDFKADPLAHPTLLLGALERANQKKPGVYIQTLDQVEALKQSAPQYPAPNANGITSRSGMNVTVDDFVREDALSSEEHRFEMDMMHLKLPRLKTIQHHTPSHLFSYVNGIPGMRYDVVDVTTNQPVSISAQDLRQVLQGNLSGVEAQKG